MVASIRPKVSQLLLCLVHTIYVSMEPHILRCIHCALAPETTVTILCVSTVPVNRNEVTVLASMGSQALTTSR